MNIFSKWIDKLAAYLKTEEGRVFEYEAFGSRRYFFLISSGFFGVLCDMKFGNPCSLYYGTPFTDSISNYGSQLAPTYIADVILNYLPAYQDMFNLAEKYRDLDEKRDEVKRLPVYQYETQSIQLALEQIESQMFEIKQQRENFVGEMRLAYSGIEKLRVEVEGKLRLELEETLELDLDGIRQRIAEAKMNTKNIQAIAAEISSLDF